MPFSAPRGGAFLPFAALPFVFFDDEPAGRKDERGASDKARNEPKRPGHRTSAKGGQYEPIPQERLVMSAFIILSANEAGAVSGPSTETPTLAALQPIALNDGRFTLGAEVMTDPAHAEHLAFLSTLPTVELAGIASLLPTAAPAPSLGARMLNAVKSFFAPDPVG